MALVRVANTLAARKKLKAERTRHVGECLLPLGIFLELRRKEASHCSFQVSAGPSGSCEQLLWHTYYTWTVHSDSSLDMFFSASLALQVVVLEMGDSQFAQLRTLALASSDASGEIITQPTKGPLP